MYLAIDIGGTKTLVAVFAEDGKITESAKFPTPENYDDFLDKLAATIPSLEAKDFQAAGMAAPGLIDRTRGIARRFGNLNWRDVPLQRDVERITLCPVALENDANLAGLSEALLAKEYEKVLYMTVSTGIGTGFIVNQQIEPSMADNESGQMMLQRGDRMIKWESFASGKAIVERYGKRAVDITDEKTWRQISKDLAVGLIGMLAMTQPDVVIIGGSVGNYTDRFQKFLAEELNKYSNPMVPIPPIKQAARPDEAVIYGCYSLAKEKYGRDPR